MVRDAQTIQAEIERARDGLAAAVDELTTRVDPRRTIDNYKRRAQEIWNDPRVKYPAMGLGAVVLVLMVRKLFR